MRACVGRQEAAREKRKRRRWNGGNSSEPRHFSGRKPLAASTQLLPTQALSFVARYSLCMEKAREPYPTDVDDAEWHFVFPCPTLMRLAPRNVTTTCAKASTPCAEWRERGQDGQLLSHDFLRRWFITPSDPLPPGGGGWAHFGFGIPSRQ